MLCASLFVIPLSYTIIINTDTLPIALIIIIIAFVLSSAFFYNQCKTYTDEGQKIKNQIEGFKLFSRSFNSAIVASMSRPGSSSGLGSHGSSGGGGGGGGGGGW